MKMVKERYFFDEG